MFEFGELRVLQTSLVILWMIFMVLIGFYFRKRASTSAHDFYTGGATTGIVVNAFALLAALMSGGGLMGNIGVAAHFGIPFILAANLGAGLGMFLASLTTAGPLRKLEVNTISEFFVIRYRNFVPISIIMAATIAIGYTFYLVAQMKASATVGSFLLGLPYGPSLIMAWLVFTVFVFLGGMYAVTWTDFLQGVLMMIVSFGTAVGALVYYGGFGKIIGTATELLPTIGTVSMPITAYLGFFVIWVGVCTIAPHILQRAFASRNPFVAKISFSWGLIIVTFFSVFTLIICGAATRIAIGPEALPNRDAAFLMLVQGIFNPFMEGVVAAGIFAAIISTGSSMLLAASSALSNDIIVKVFKPDMDSKTQITLARVFVLVIAVVVLLISFFDPPEFLTLLYSAAMGLLVSVTFFPLLLGIWWRRTTRIGAFLGMVTGFLVYGIPFAFMSLPMNSHILYSLPASLVVTVVGSLLSGEPSQEEVDLVENLHA